MIENIQFPSISIDREYEINYHADKDDLLNPTINYYEDGRYSKLTIIDEKSNIFLINESRIVRDKLGFFSKISKKFYAHKLLIEITDMTWKYCSLDEIKTIVSNAMRNDSFWLAGGDLKKRVHDVSNASTVANLINLFNDLQL